MCMALSVGSHSALFIQHTVPLCYSEYKTLHTQPWGWETGLPVQKPAYIHALFSGHLFLALGSDRTGRNQAVCILKALCSSCFHVHEIKYSTFLWTKWNEHLDAETNWRRQENWKKLNLAGRAIYSDAHSHTQARILHRCTEYDSW